MVVIERLSHALARGATPLAIAAGYGTSADAYHLTAGSPDGAGAQVAMRSAIRTAGLTPDDIGYVNAHATSTEVGDNAEINGIARGVRPIAARRWRYRRRSPRPATCSARPARSRRCISVLALRAPDACRRR